MNTIVLDPGEMIEPAFRIVAMESDSVVWQINGDDGSMIFNNSTIYSGTSNYPPLSVIPTNGKTKCQHCGQWGEARSECGKCGAPIDPEKGLRP